MTKRLLVIFGKRTANEIHAAAQIAYGTFFDRYEVSFFDADSQAELLSNTIQEHFDEKYFCIGVVDYDLRIAIEKTAVGMGMIPFTVIHPSSVIDSTAKIGVGCFIGPLCVVSIATVIEDFSILHLHCSVGHDCTIRRHCTVLPGARISGDVVLGQGVLVGSNSFVYQGSRIGDQTQIDALTYVKGDVPARSIVSARHASPLKRIF
jgi:acetyltransferase-like isoleucine patch superfamily enzyme